MKRPEKITLIIGAGANKEISQEIDLGIELIKNISNRITDRTTPRGRNLSASIEEHFDHLNENVRTDFLIHLDHYISTVDSPSIDEFLNEIETYPEFKNQRDNFLDIGILYIIAHVVGWEGTSTVNFLDNKDEVSQTWLSVFDQDILHQANFNIITFNYDRILEYHLLKYFPKEAKQFIKDHVHHVYGRIASLHGLIPFDDEVELEFDQPGVPNNNFTFLNKLKKNIHLIRQKVDTTPIKNIIKESDGIILFGYGLDAINNKRIGLHEWQDRRDEHFVCNIHSGSLPDYNFACRRKMSDKIRSIRVDADIQYKTSKDFLHYALNEKVWLDQSKK